MTNRDIIQRFINGASRGVCNHLTIRSDELINYTTPILRRITAEHMLLDARKYSVTTSRVQSTIRAALSSAGFECVDSNDVSAVVYTKGGM